MSRIRTRHKTANSTKQNKNNRKGQANTMKEVSKNTGDKKGASAATTPESKSTPVNKAVSSAGKYYSGKYSYVKSSYQALLDLLKEIKSGKFDEPLSFTPDEPKEIDTIFKLTQDELMKYVAKRLKDEGYNPIKTVDYVYAPGKHPVLLVAHLDTVHDQIPHFILKSDCGTIWSSPFGVGGDDRAGVYMVLQTIKRFKCSVLFTTDEEIGGYGAKAFVHDLGAGKVRVDANYIIEYDRKGRDDAVFYNCGNDEFISFVESVGFKECYGSFSDISIIAPVLDLAAVNLSSGYYNPHSDDEYVVFPYVHESLEKALKLIGTYVKAPFDYQRAVVETTYPSGYYRNVAEPPYSSGYQDEWDKKWDDYYANFGKGKKSSTLDPTSVKALVVMDADTDFEDDYDEEYGGLTVGQFRCVDGYINFDNGDLIDNDGSYFIDLNGDLFQYAEADGAFGMLEIPNATPLTVDGALYPMPSLMDDGWEQYPYMSW